jgi:hypothetical protein
MQHRENHSLARNPCEAPQTQSAQLPGVNFVLHVINPRADFPGQLSAHMVLNSTCRVYIPSILTHAKLKALMAAGSDRWSLRFSSGPCKPSQANPCQHAPLTTQPQTIRIGRAA